MIVFPNFSYYLKNESEFIDDLGYMPDDEIIKELPVLLEPLESLDQLEALEQLDDIISELFYNIMCKIFGNNEYNDTANKSYIVKDFRILYLDANFIFATCEIYGNYLYFDYSI